MTAPSAKGGKTRKAMRCCTACKDSCTTGLRLLLFVTGLTAIVMSIMTASSCEFLHYSVPNSELSVPDLPNVTSATIGLFRYDPDGDGCRDLPSSDTVFGTRFHAARVGSLVSILFCATAMLITWIEFLCCRFCCSRLIISTLLLTAQVFQIFTFLAFGSDFCTQTEENQAYPCNAGTGSIYSIVAVGLYFMAALMICFTSKPEPVCKKLRETDENDSCMYPSVRQGDVPSSTMEEAEKGVVDPSKAAYPPNTTDQEQITLSSAESYAAYSSNGRTEYRQPYQYYYPSGASQERAPTTPSLPTYRDVAILDGDLFFDSEGDS